MIVVALQFIVAKLVIYYNNLEYVKIRLKINFT